MACPDETEKAFSIAAKWEPVPPVIDQIRPINTLVDPRQAALNLSTDLLRAQPTPEPPPMTFDAHQST